MAKSLVDLPTQQKLGCVGYAEFILCEALHAQDWELAEYIYSPTTAPPIDAWKPRKLPPSPLPPPLVKPLAEIPTEVSVDVMPLEYPPIIHFALLGNAGAVLWLVTHGACVSVRSALTSGSLTVFHAAALSGNLPIVRLLFDHYQFSPKFLKLPMALRTERGWRELDAAIWLANRLNHHSMVQYLLERGGETPHPKPYSPFLGGSSAASGLRGTHWSWRRLLYVARFKPNERCHMSKLPLDIIRKIDGYYCYNDARHLLAGVLKGVPLNNVILFY